MRQRCMQSLQACPDLPDDSAKGAIPKLNERDGVDVHLYIPLNPQVWAVSNAATKFVKQLLWSSQLGCRMRPDWSQLELKR